MKPAKYMMNIVMAVLMVGIAAYFAVYTAGYFANKMESTVLYTYTAEDRITISGYLFREEVPVAGENTLADAAVAEGEKVAAGSTLARVYENQQAMSSHQRLRELEGQLEVLASIRSSSADDVDTSALNQRINGSIVELRTSVLRGNLSRLEEQVSETRKLIYRQDYTYNGNDALDAEITELRGEISKLSGNLEKNVSTVNAEQSGIFSSQVDGYENIMTLEMLDRLTPELLEQLAASPEVVNEGEWMGKLITSNHWCFAANLNEVDAAQLHEGKVTTLRFNSVGDLRFTVERMSRPDDKGRVTVIFGTDAYLSKVTLLRDQTVELVLGSCTGYRVDTAAVYVADNTDGSTGVYRIYGQQASWVPVEILYRGEEYYLIRQTRELDENGKEKELSELQQAKQLRDGVEVVLKGKDLYDGKVIK